MGISEKLGYLNKVIILGINPKRGGIPLSDKIKRNINEDWAIDKIILEFVLCDIIVLFLKWSIRGMEIRI